MAIEIIPKKIEKISDARKKLFYFSIFLFLGLLLGYFILTFLEKKSENTLPNLEEALLKGKTPEMSSLEEEILNDQKKIKDFSSLVQSHLIPSKIFEFFEKNTLPQVFFSEINLNSLNSTAKLSGECDSFVTLGQQLAIFEKEPLIEKLDLTQVSITKEGKIGFFLDFSFNPKILKQ
jgi:hypothetical protein